MTLRSDSVRGIARRRQISSTRYKIASNQNKNKNVTTGRFARVDEPWETATMIGCSSMSILVMRQNYVGCITAF